MSDTSNKFESVTVIVVATNETSALRETISVIRNTCRDEDIEKIIVVVKDTKCNSYLEMQKIFAEKKDEKLVCDVQSFPGIGYVSRFPKMADSSHFIVMASDLENDPTKVQEFIERAKLHPNRIISASKWLKESRVEGYSFIHEIGSRAINNFVRVLYHKDIREPFTFYQIYPKSIYEKYEDKFSTTERFMYEYTLIPLNAGEEYEEIPTVCKSRKEGKSNYNYLFYFKMAIEFCWTAVKIRFSKGYKNERKTK